MPTVVLRPTSTDSHTGWAADPIGTAGDNNLSTGVAQNNVTCNWTAVLEDLDSSLSSATINSFTISANATPGRAGACTAEMSLGHATDGSFAAETEAWTGGANATKTTTAHTKQQDGSSALTYAYINDCKVKIDPNNQGMTLYELYVTVDYTPGGYGNTVNGVTSANIGKVNGVATADIEKVNGI
tara:strand:+ start:24 stop:578 length:555 start_codon:yes stop_codon:yes gene_type:complete